MAVRFCHHFLGGVIYKEESVKQENGRRGGRRFYGKYVSRCKGFYPETEGKLLGNMSADAKGVRWSSAVRCCRYLLQPA